MTFEELDAKLPNGFHDAEISRLTIDYQDRSATFRMNLWVSLPDNPNQEEYRKALLVLHGLCYCSVEVPDATSAFLAERSKITVAGYPEDPASFSPFERLKPALPVGAFCCRFFVHDWNSFIHVAASRVEFGWAEGSG